MTKTFAARIAPAALAALLTGSMFLATNALASHQYRVAAAAQGTQMASADVQVVTIVGHRIARA
jgi:hypothetical protein